MCATWEPATSLPKQLVKNFEEGVVTESGVEFSPQYGHITHTLTVAQRSDEQQPEAKRMRKERPCLTHDLQGYICSKPFQRTLIIELFAVLL